LSGAPAHKPAVALGATSPRTPPLVDRGEDGGSAGGGCGTALRWEVTGDARPGVRGGGAVVGWNGLMERAEDEGGCPHLGAGTGDGAGEPSRLLGGGVEDRPWAPRDDLGEPSVFQPAALLTASRHQRGLPAVAVPRVCVLDPDGDLADHAAAVGPTSKHPGWACYHTDMWTLATAVGPVGVVGRAVGAPFAVLVAEQLAVSGADLVISLSSAGRVGPTRAVGPGGELLVIDRALACYDGWAEAKLSMLFSAAASPTPFCTASQEIRPLDPGWEGRLPLLNRREHVSVIAHFGDTHTTVHRVRAVLDRSHHTPVPGEP